MKRLRTYRWAENTRKDGQVLEERPLKRDDDLCDALRYAVMGFPELPAWEAENLPRASARTVDPSVQWAADRMARVAAAEARRGAEPESAMGDFLDGNRSREYSDDEELYEDTDEVAVSFWG